jgi:hypothetical protein
VLQASKIAVGQRGDDGCLCLETTGDGVRRLDPVFHRGDNLQQALRTATAAATRDRKHGLFG